MSKQPAAALSPELEEAFKYLQTYDWGSGRAGLAPIDEAVHDCGKNGQAKELEVRFLATLSGGAPAPAREYICSRLAMMGTERAVSALKALLGDAESTMAACDALEKIPGSAAAKALRSALPRLEGRQRAAVVRSLGVRRDAGSVREIAKFLKDPDADVASRAAEAMGQIGTIRCARLLKEQSTGGEAGMFDALLACAERLKQDGRTAEAVEVYRFVSSTTLTPHIKRAAMRKTP